MYDKQKVIDIALTEVGYLEKATNDQLDNPTANAGKKNYTKYARDLAAYPFYNGNKSGVAWCDVFVDWCFVQAYGVDAARMLTCQPTNSSVNYGAGCKYSRQYYAVKGRLFDDPEPGDQIFFWSKDKTKVAHTGLVYKVDDSKVYTVEGNTSGDAGVVSNGGGVFKKSYSRTYGRLAGFGRPDYEAEQKEVTSVIDYHETIRKGAKGAAVVSMQGLLIRRGYDIEADGKFGNATRDALMAFQGSAGLEADGICGPMTWEALRDGLPDEEMIPEGPKEKTWEQMSVSEKVDDLHKWRLSMTEGGESDG